MPQHHNVLLLCLFSLFGFLLAQTVPDVYYIPATPANTTFKGVIDNDSGVVYLTYITSAPTATNPFVLRAILTTGGNVTDVLELASAACGLPGFRENLIDFVSSGVQTCEADPNGSGFCVIPAIASCAGDGGIQTLYYFRVTAQQDFVGEPLGFTLNILEVSVADIEELGIPANGGSIYLGDRLLEPDQTHRFSLDISELSSPAVVTVASSASDGAQVDYTLSYGPGQACVIASANLDTVSGSGLFAQIIAGTDCDLTEDGSAIPATVYLTIQSDIGVNVTYDLHVTTASSPTITSLTDGDPQNQTVLAGQVKYFSIADVSPNAPLEVTVTTQRDGDVLTLSIDRGNFYPGPSCDEESDECFGVDDDCVVALDPCDDPASDGQIRIAVAGALTSLGVNPDGGNSTSNLIPFRIIAQYGEAPPDPSSAIGLTENEVYNATSLERDEWYDFRLAESALDGALAVGFWIELTREDGEWEAPSRVDIIFSRGAITRDQGCPGSILAPGTFVSLVGATVLFTGELSWNCDALSETTGDLFLSIRTRAGPGGDWIYYAKIHLIALSTIDLPIGTTSSGHETLGWANTPILFALTGFSEPAGEIVVRITTPNNDSNVLVAPGSVAVYGTDLCNTVVSGVAIPAPEYPDANTAVFSVVWLCLAPDDLIFAFYAEDRFEFDIRVDITDNATEFVPGQDPPIVLEFEHVLAQERKRIYFNVDPAQSIIVEGIGEGEGGGGPNAGDYSMQLYRATDCAFQDDNNCPGDGDSCFLSISRPSEGGAGRWYVQVQSNSNGANTVTINVTLGLENCVDVTLTGNNFCFDAGVTTTSLFGSFVDVEELEFEPHLVYKAFDALPGATQECLDAVRSFLCNTAFDKCDGDGWVQDVSESCDQCEAFVSECASSEACAVDDNLCAGICAGSDGDGDGSVASALQASLLHLL